MSLFQAYPSKYPRCGLSFGIEQAILQAITNEDLTEESFRQAVHNSYALVYTEKVVTENFDGILARVLQRIDELEKKENEKQTSAPRKGKTFGSSFADWLAELDPTQSCLYLADYDLQKALHYYWNEDYLLVQEAIKLKSGHESQLSLIRLESAMYGFGGGYKDDNGAGDPNTINVDDANPEDIQAFMSGFGF